MNTANNLLYLIVATLLSFMGVSGFFGKRNLSKLQIWVHPPDEVFAGIEIPIAITLVNHRRFLPAFLMRLSVGGRIARFPFVSPGQQVMKLLPLIFHRRGNQVLRDLYLSSVFPFNFFVRYRRISKEVKLIVLPRPIKCDENVAKENGGAQRGEQTVDQAGFDPDILWLRNYFAGDPIRYIHWKASARTDILKTKQFSSATLPPLILDFNNIVIQNIERKLSCLTYLIMTLTNKNRPVGLRIREKFFEPGLSRRHRFRMLNELALYGDQDDEHPD